MDLKLEDIRKVYSRIVPGPDSIPHLKNIDIYGGTTPLNGVAGGDHLRFVDFNRDVYLQKKIRKAQAQDLDEIVEQLRGNRQKAGILVADVSGHDISDFLWVMAIDSAFRVGLEYELKESGHVTVKLFDRINTAMHKIMPIGKYATMFYGEILEDGSLRYISAAHPHPIVFSKEFGTIQDIHESSLAVFPPIGVMPTEGYLDEARYIPPLGFKKRYEVNRRLKLESEGDLFILASDGLTDHHRISPLSKKTEFYRPTHLQAVLRQVCELSARDIYFEVLKDAMDFEQIADDLTLVVGKRIGTPKNLK